MADAQTTSVFLSYASPDRDRVQAFYEHLKARGFSPWMDVHELLPGQHWEFEIRRALDSASLVVIFVSRNSVDRTGYVQKELRISLSKLQERPKHHIYLIPVVLDRDAQIPSELLDLQCLFADRPDAFAQLSEALNRQLESLGAARANATREGEVSWTFGRLQESWEGLPGYEIDIKWPIYKSARYPMVGQAGEIIKGTFLSAAAHQRAAKVGQTPELYSFGQDKWPRTNLYAVECPDPVIRGSVLSQLTQVHWYGAGAAHPNRNFRSFSFLLDPLILIDSLEEIFENPAEALRVLQDLIRPQLAKSLERSVNSEPPSVDTDWIERGTNEWSDFANWVFEQDGIALYFDPYQVASYADGEQVARVPYKTLCRRMRKPYIDALVITHLTYG